MPTVPVYQRQVREQGLPSVYQRGGFTADDFGAQEAKKLGEIGEKLGDALEVKMKADGEAKAYEAISKARLDNTKRLLDLQKTMPAGAEGFTEEYLKQHDEYYKGVIDSIDNPYARQALERDYQSTRAQFGQQALLYQAQEGVRFRAEKITNAADNDAKFLQSLDPAQADAALEQMVSEGDSIIESQPFSPEQKAKLKDESRQLRVQGAWQARLNNPQGLAEAIQYSQPSPEAPRGIRNHNPGNLRPSGDAWQGMVGDDGGYLKFASPEAGLRALAINLVNQQEKRGMDTVRKIISRYAPNSENNTDAYVAAVSKSLGVEPGEKIDIKNPDTLTKFMAAVVQHENGQNPYSVEQLQAAARLGLSKEPAPVNMSESVFGASLSKYMTSEEQARAMGQAQRVYGAWAKEQEKLMQMQAYMSAVENGQSVYMPDKERKEAIDVHFESFMQTVEGDPFQASIDYAKRFGTVPTRVVGMIQGMVRSNKGNDIVAAVEGVDQMRATNPRLLEDFKADDLRVINLAQSYIESGFKPEQIVEKLTVLDNVNPSVRKAREEEYAEILKKDGTDKFIAAKHDTLFGNDPNEVPAGMVADFDRVAMSEYALHGNMDAARKTASDTIKRIWDVSEITGKPTWTRRSPETQYGIPGLSRAENADWMREQILTDLTKSSFLPADAEFSIVGINVNDRSGFEPVYNVTIQSDLGEFIPFSYKPSWETSPAFMRIREDNYESLSEAIENRQRWLRGERRALESTADTLNKL